MSAPFLCGPRVYLRTPEIPDAPLVEKWLHDPAVNRYLNSGQLPSKSSKMAVWLALNDTSERDLRFAVCMNQGRPIGTVAAMQIDPIHRSCEVGIIIGETDCWDFGIGTEALSLLIDHLFERYNLRRIELNLFVFNERARRSYKKLGFVTESVRRRRNFKDGVYEDVATMGLLRRDYTSVTKQGD